MYEIVQHSFYFNYFLDCKLSIKNIRKVLISINNIEHLTALTLKLIFLSHKRVKMILITERDFLED